jgi:site-specific DNA-methyltransferase (adenine-specific)
MEFNKIYNMDCVEGMRMLPDQCIDLTVTSPPYDNLRTYNGFTWDFEAVARELYRVTKQGGVVVWIVADATIKGSETGTSFKQALYFKKIGFNLHDTMIWNKGMLTFPNPLRYHNGFEYMFIFSKGRPNTVNLIEDRVNKYAGAPVHGTDRQVNGETKKQAGNGKRRVKEKGARFNVWNIPPVQSSKERTGHPAQFPEKLAIDHIISWSCEGNAVLDPFSGSGTTAVACINTNRKYIGFEISKEYCEIANARLREAKE